MNTAISNIAWAAADRLTAYQLMQNHGVTGLELAPGLFMQSQTPYDSSPQARQLAKQEAVDFGLQLVSMQAIHFGAGEMQLFETPQLRANLLDYTKRAIEFAASLAIPNLVFGSPKNRCIPEGMSTEQVEAIAVSFFTELGDFAQQHGTCVSLEANAREYGTNFMTTTEEALAMVQKVYHQGIRLNLDMGTMLMAGEGIETLLFALPFANHIHISAPFLEPIYLEDTAFYENALQAIATSTYDRFISIEMKASTLPVQEHLLQSFSILRYA